MWHADTTEYGGDGCHLCALLSFGAAHATKANLPLVWVLMHVLFYVGGGARSGYA